MGRADYYSSGDWNFRCDLCGAKRKSKDGRKTWDGHYVCAHHKEVRNPQDFLRGVKDNQSVPWSRPGGNDLFVPPPQCTLKTSNAIPGWGAPGCAIPSQANMAFLPSEPGLEQYPTCTIESISGIPGFAGPGCSVPSLNSMGLQPVDTGFGFD